MPGSIETAYDNTRTKRMRDRRAASPWEVCLERARFFTQAYRECPDQPVVLRQAKGLDRTLRQMTLLLDEDDRLVGNVVSTETLKDAQDRPENYRDLMELRM